MSPEKHQWGIESPSAPKTSFQEMLKSCLEKWVINSEQARELLSRFNEEKDQIIVVTKKELEQLKVLIWKEKVDSITNHFVKFWRQVKKGKVEIFEDTALFWSGLKNALSDLAFREHGTALKKWNEAFDAQDFKIAYWMLRSPVLDLNAKELAGLVWSDNVNTCLIRFAYCCYDLYKNGTKNENMLKEAKTALQKDVLRGDTRAEKLTQMIDQLIK